MAVLNWLEFDKGVNSAGLYTSTIQRLNQGNCLDWHFKSDFFSFNVFDFLDEVCEREKSWALVVHHGSQNMYLSFSCGFSMESESIFTRYFLA
tara:strand:+ start:1028 stop:1306 length:279 start_codon:yes stop_codon:yes gene_type:complete